MVWASQASGLYDRARPTYPLRALNRIIACLPKENAEVVELGVGTGIFTRALLEAAKEGQIHRVIAIDPAEGMRVAFQKAISEWKTLHTSDPTKKCKSIPEITCCEGSFEDTGPFVQNASVDLAVAAQAWHWTGSDVMVQELSVKEMARVVKPGGYLAILWNLKDRESNDWVGKIRDMYEVYEAGTPQYRLGFWKSLFRTPSFESCFELLPPEDNPDPSDSNRSVAEKSQKNVDDSLDQSKPTLTVTRYIPTTFNELYERILSKSYMSRLDIEAHEKFKTELESIWNKRVIGNPSVKWTDISTVKFPYVTHLYLLRRR